MRLPQIVTALFEPAGMFGWVMVDCSERQLVVGSS